MARGSRQGFGTFLPRAAGALTSLARTYSAVLFGDSALAGALIALSTFLVPEHGLSGLAGLLSAAGAARLVGRPKAERASGFHAVNGLLVGLALGWAFRLTLPLAVFIALTGFVTVLVGTGIQQLLNRYVGVPAMSAPFTLVTWIALLASARFTLELGIDTTAAAQLGTDLVPAPIALFLQSLGAVLFQPSVAAGALVLVGLLIASRWAAVSAALAFTVGAALYLGLGGAATDLTAHLIGFNFILVGIALGGVYLVLSPMALVWVGLASLVTALVAAATLQVLSPWALPVLALPFVVVTQAVLYLIAQRVDGTGQLVRGALDSAEGTLIRAAFGALRYPDPAVPVFHPPVMGAWLITQGHHGQHTHQGLWAHAWDFQVADSDGAVYSGDGTQLSDHYAFGAPVVAAAAGTVVRVVQHLDDNPIGEVDVAHNWGNLVLLWHPGEVYSLVCHLEKNSVALAVGAAVTRGQLLGRVGNSGRSPVPHLHFHVQRSPEVGAPTTYAELLHYAADGTYQTHGVPAEGQSIATIALNKSVREALVLPPGGTWDWTLSDGQQSTWSSHIDALGKRHLADDRGHRAGIYVDANYLTTLESHRAGAGLLGLFTLATPRVPCTDDREIVWHDQLPAAPFVSAAARIVHDLSRPFREVGAVHTTSRLLTAASGAGDVTVRTELDWSQVVGARSARLPTTIEVAWRTGRGPVAIAAWSGTTLLLQAHDEETP